MRAQAASGWWPIWGDPPLPFGGQQPTILHGTALGDPINAPLDITVTEDYPHPGELLVTGWRGVFYWDAGVGPWAARLTEGYSLSNGNIIMRPLQPEDGNSLNWGTSITTSVDPTDYWPKLPPRSTWLWVSRYQGGVFQLNTVDLHSVHIEAVGCNKNRGLRAYFIWSFTDLFDSHAQAYVVRTCGR